MRKILFVMAIIGSANAAEVVHDDGSNVVWTAIFENQVPNAGNVTQEYCDKHTPDIITTNIKQITSSNGVAAKNGVSIQYQSYKGEEINGLYFNTVKGYLKGTGANGKEWTVPISLYEQTLAEVGKTYTVWSTPYCKGTFIGYPSVVSPTK